MSAAACVFKFWDLKESYLLTTEWDWRVFNFFQLFIISYQSWFQCTVKKIGFLAPHENLFLIFFLQEMKEQGLYTFISNECLDSTHLPCLNLPLPLPLAPCDWTCIDRDFCSGRQKEVIQLISIGNVRSGFWYLRAVLYTSRCLGRGRSTFLLLSLWIKAGTAGQKVMLLSVENVGCDSHSPATGSLQELSIVRSSLAIVRCTICLNRAKLYRHFVGIKPH